MATSKALCFGSDGWNFKNDEHAIASCTRPSCHMKAAKTARKLSAKHDGSARFGCVAVLFVKSFISCVDIRCKLSLINDVFSLSFSTLEKWPSMVAVRWKKFDCEFGDQSENAFDVYCVESDVLRSNGNGGLIARESSSLSLLAALSELNVLSAVSSDLEPLKKLPCPGRWTITTTSIMIVSHGAQWMIYTIKARHTWRRRLRANAAAHGRWHSGIAIAFGILWSADRTHQISHRHRGQFGEIAALFQLITALDAFALEPFLQRLQFVRTAAHYARPRTAAVHIHRMIAEDFRIEAWRMMHGGRDEFLCFILIVCVHVRSFRIFLQHFSMQFPHVRFVAVTIKGAVFMIAIRRTVARLMVLFSNKKALKKCQICWTKQMLRKVSYFSEILLDRAVVQHGRQANRMHCIT